MYVYVQHRNKQNKRKSYSEHLHVSGTVYWFFFCYREWGDVDWTIPANNNLLMPNVTDTLTLYCIPFVDEDFRDLERSARVNSLEFNS